jgi:hypothetical protein
MKRAGDFQFSRRTLLRAAGSTLLVPTFLKQAFAQRLPTAPNLVLFQQTNGQNVAGYWPTATAFTSTILKDLLTDPIVGPKTTVIKGINLKLMGSPGGNGHDWGWHGFYSGYDNVPGPGGQFGGGPSIDQVLKSKLNFTTPFSTLHTGVTAVNYRLVNAGRASFVSEAAQKLIMPDIDIYAEYTKVFGSVTPSTTPPSAADAQAASRRLAQRKSVLDAVASDLQTLEGRLGPSEKAKVDAHLQSVREFEMRLSDVAAAGSASRPANCGMAKPSKLGVPTTGQGNEANAPALLDLWMEFIGNAIACNMASVVTFQAGRGGEHFEYAWLGIPELKSDFHDNFAHKDHGDGSAASVLAAKATIPVGQYYAKLMLALGQKLASFPQANGMTALDNSLVVWGNELATGPHGINGYPISLLGGAAGKLKKTGYLLDVGQQAHHLFLTSIMNIMGVPATGVGLQPNCGQLPGLTLG